MMTYNWNKIYHQNNINININIIKQVEKWYNENDYENDIEE